MPNSGPLISNREIVGRVPGPGRPLLLESVYAPQTLQSRRSKYKITIFGPHSKSSIKASERARYFQLAPCTSSKFFIQFSSRFSGLVFFRRCARPRVVHEKPVGEPVRPAAFVCVKRMEFGSFAKANSEVRAHICPVITYALL